MRSVRTVTLIDGGSAACSCGSSVLMRSTTSMMLAPGCRWMLTITAGVVVHPGRLPDVLDAVDRRWPRRSDRTGAPLLIGDDQRRWYCSAVSNWSLAPIV